MALGADQFKTRSDLGSLGVQVMRVQTKSNTEREGVALNQRAFETIGLLFREQTIHDYGIDAHLEIVENGLVTGRLIGLQIKSGPSYCKERDDDGFVYRSDGEHIQYWLNHSLPVILTICDTESGRVYWQEISQSTVVSTGKHWRLTVPKAQVVDHNALGQLSELATKIVAADKYSILKQDDISASVAKRYRLKVLLNDTLTKPEIATVIRQVVTEYARSRYYRNKRVESRWGDSDATVICIFVYLSLDDVRDLNWICESMWIDENYPPELPHPTLDGENIGCNIVAKWSSRYAERAKVMRTFSVKKEDYFAGVDAIIARLVPLMKKISAVLQEERLDRSKDAGPALQKMSVEIDRLSKSFHELGRPPLECEEVDVKVTALVHYVYSIAMPYFLDCDSPKRNRYVEEYSVEDFNRTLPQYIYELEKAK